MRFITVACVGYSQDLKLQTGKLFVIVRIIAPDYCNNLDT